MSERKIDLRMPVSVMFDLNISGVNAEDYDKAIAALHEAVRVAPLETIIAEYYDQHYGQVGSGTRYDSCDIDSASVAYREHAESGSFTVGRPVIEQEAK